MNHNTPSFQTQSSYCSCVGPQNGEPFCPCRMKYGALAPRIHILHGKAYLDLGYVDTGYANLGGPIPTVTPSFPIDWGPTYWNPAVTDYGVCGLRNSGYVCSRNDCPGKVTTIANTKSAIENLSNYWANKRSASDGDV